MILSLGVSRIRYEQTTSECYSLFVGLLDLLHLDALCFEKLLQLFLCHSFGVWDGGSKRWNNSIRWIRGLTKTKLYWKTARFQMWAFYLILPLLLQCPLNPYCFTRQDVFSILMIPPDKSNKGKARFSLTSYPTSENESGNKATKLICCIHVLKTCHLHTNPLCTSRISWPIWPAQVDIAVFKSGIFK